MPNNPRLPALDLHLAERVWRLVVDEAGRAGAPDELVRQACALTLVRASAGRVRPGALVELETGSVNLRRGSVSVLHRPPGPSRTGPYVRAYDLDDAALVMVRRWLAVRRRLVAGLDEDGGVVRSLFVTTAHTTRRDGRQYPVGLPLHRDGFITSHRRLSERLNAEHAGTYGWEPLPTSMEQLRRAWQYEG